MGQVENLPPVANRRSLDARRAMFSLRLCCSVGQLFQAADPISSGPAGRKAGLAGRVVQPERVIYGANF